MNRAIPKGLSIYLDFVRLAAAIVVFLSHLWPLVFPSTPLPWPGHLAVVVFFVLSGYVISHAARPELGLRGYAVHRLARIYPVLIAAALLSLVIAAYTPVNIGNYGSSRGSDWFDITLNMAFLGQSWMDVPMPYVGTVWSLDYEVWYYILFAIWTYHRSWVLLACAALVAGPKILLLLPVWLLGVALHRSTIVIKRKYAIWLFGLSSITGIAFWWFSIGTGIREAMRPLSPGLIVFAEGSNQFVGDFIFGLIVMLNFKAAGSLRMELLLKMQSVIRYLSSFTFSLYIFHLPLAVLIWNGFQVHSAFAFFTLLIAGVWLLGMLTEQQSKWYRSILSRFMLRKKAKESLLRERDPSLV